MGETTQEYEFHFSKDFPKDGYISGFSSAWVTNNKFCAMVEDVDLLSIGYTLLKIDGRKGSA